MGWYVGGGGANAPHGTQFRWAMLVQQPSDSGGASGLPPLRQDSIVTPQVGPRHIRIVPGTSTPVALSTHQQEPMEPLHCTGMKSPCSSPGNTFNCQ